MFFRVFSLVEKGELRHSSLLLYAQQLQVVVPTHFATCITSVIESGLSACLNVQYSK